MNRPLAALALLVLPVASAPAAKPPNVVLVITDDQGYGDLSCHGNPVLKTPNLDALHAESVRLTDYHVAPTCAPTRSALMSGHYTNRTGCWHTIMGRSLLREGEATLGQAFRASGYETGMFGKWHMGDNYPFRPEDRGFSEVVRHGGGGVGQTPDFWDNAYFDDTYFHNGKPEKYEGYCTDIFFREARRFIEESVAKDKPFMAYIATNAPHGPFHCPDKHWKPYAGKPGVSDQTAVFFGMIANIDENVGALRDWLARKGLAENTIFIFTTDNGTASGAQVFNDGMRGAKGSEFDGGHRVPFFLHWPAGKLNKPRDIGEICAAYDILPTLIDLCGLKKLEGYAFDGVSLAGLITGAVERLPERVLITDSQRVRDPIKWRKSATMTDRWRLVNGTQLYDIEADPGQKNDLAAGRPEVVEKLRGAYESWWADLEPGFKEYARIVVGHPDENPSRLTCHDWLTDQALTPWNQASIRASKKPLNGEWAIRVHADGDYEVTLRRWPDEGGAAKPALTDGLAPGAPVPGLRAYREAKGAALPVTKAILTVGGECMEKKPAAGAAHVKFKIRLRRGDAMLRGEFALGEEGGKIGAYYAYVRKL